MLNCLHRLSSRVGSLFGPRLLFGQCFTIQTGCPVRSIELLKVAAVVTNDVRHNMAMQASFTKDLLLLLSSDRIHRRLDLRESLAVGCTHMHTMSRTN